MVILLVGIAIIVMFIVLKAIDDNRAIQERKQSIHQKYGYTEIADRIINKNIWVGETSEQLLDSLGQPLDIDQKVFKTKTKEIWKYYRYGINRYGLRMIIENDVVVGWDKK